MSPVVTAPDVEFLKAQLRKKLDTLPQRDLIDLSDASQWIDYMANLMPADAMWHMVRAGGVGGSEIGGLVRNYLGARADHEFSAHDWALHKLLRKTPEPATDVLARGHAMEPLHAQRFYQDYKTGRDKAAYDRLSKAQGSAVWMRYSPDDVVFFDSATTFQQAAGAPVALKGRVLVDYKAPTTVDEAARIAFQYSCQLHQGAILCEEQGIDLTGAMLSQFNWATWSLKNDFVTIDPELCELIRAAGDHYWDYVMRGEIPDYIFRRRLALDPKTHDEWQEAATRLAQLNAMKTRLENAAEDVRAKLAQGLDLANQRLDGQTVVFPGALKISAVTAVDEDKVRKALGEAKTDGLMMKEKQTKYDTDALVKKLKELDVDVKPFRKMTRLDPSATFSALQEAGLDAEEFVVEQLRFGVEKEMKDQTGDWFDASFDPLQFPNVLEQDTTPLPDSAALGVEFGDEAPPMRARMTG